MNVYRLLRDSFLYEPVKPEEHPRPRWQRRLAWLVPRWKRPIYLYPDTIEVVLVDHWDDTPCE